MKLLEIISSIEPLNALLEQKLPAKAAYKIGRLASKLSPEVDAYGKARDAKMREYGTPVVAEDGSPTNNFKFEGEGKDRFVAEMTEVENSEVEVEIPEISIDDLGDISIEPKYLTALTWLIK